MAWRRRRFDCSMIPALAQRLIAEGLRDVEQQYTWGAVSDRWAALYGRSCGRATWCPPCQRGGGRDRRAVLLREAGTR
jgi:hypothetical protein